MFRFFLFVPKLVFGLKILVLIIASDNETRYIDLQQLWRSYMHYDPEHVEAYFIRSDPNLPVPCHVEGDVIWSQGKECIIPGILRKTVASLNYFSPRLAEFDFVIRTNLSSFYIFPRLLQFLETMPQKRCYSGPKAWANGTIGSGCGIILSSDVAALIAAQKNRCLSMQNFDYDDVVLWRFLVQSWIIHIPSPLTIMTSEEALSKFQENPRPEPFHFRVGDPAIYVRLIEMFYPKK